MNDLWAQGIKCETLYQENPKPNRQLEFALESGIPLVMFIGESEVAEGIVKIKSLNKHEEYVLTRVELAEGSRLKQIIEDGNSVLLPSAITESQKGGAGEDKEVAPEGKPAPKQRGAGKQGGAGAAKEEKKKE